jgi:hypothetical protein
LPGHPDLELLLLVRVPGGKEVKQMESKMSAFVLHRDLFSSSHLLVFLSICKLCIFVFQERKAINEAFFSIPHLRGSLSADADTDAGEFFYLVLLAYPCANSPTYITVYAGTYQFSHQQN